MKYLLLWIVFCVLALSGVGQKANYKSADRFTHHKLKTLIGTTKVKPEFLKHSDKFWYKYKTGDGVRYYFVDPKAKVHREMFDRKFVAGEINEKTHGTLHYKELDLSITFLKDEKTITFKVDNCPFAYNIYTHRFVPVPEKEKTTASKKRGKYIVGTCSPDSAYVVYVKNHNLYLFSVVDSTETQLTTDGEKGFSFAKSASGNNDKTVGRVSWFPDSKSFIVERTDQRNVGRMPLMLYLGVGRPQQGAGNEYEIPGDKIVKREELYFCHVDQKKVVRVDEKWTDQKVQFFPVSEEGQMKRCYFTRKKRTCDEIDVCRVCPDGEVKVIINEVSKPYFTEDFFNLSFLNSGEEIIWWSERTGRGQLYLYDEYGNLKNAITTGGGVTGKVLKTDEKNRVIYFNVYGQVEGESPYFARVNSARLDGNGEVEMLTPEMATHDAVFSESGRYFVDNYSRVDLEPRSVVRDNKGKVILELASPDLSRLYEMGWKMPEPFTVKAADNVTDLYGYMWKPSDFDSTKIYPIISYVYPGPQSDAVPFEFIASGYHNTALAEVGFIVVNFGHRGGTPFRDKWYHMYGHGNLRDYALADDKYGIEQLADRYPFIDVDRVGIYGHSGGGFMSTAAICTYMDFYKAAVSSSGNHDNRIYNRWWGETFHGLKEVKTQEKKIEKSALTGKDTTIIEEKVSFKFDVPTNMELAKNLKGHLMLMHGDTDDNVHPAQTMRMVDALIKEGKNFDLVIFPGMKHYYIGASMEFYERKMWFHFAKHLLGDFTSEGYGEIDDYLRK